MCERVILPGDFTIERYGISLRLVQMDDAEFIVNLRTDPVLSRFLNKTSSSLQEQIDWLSGYKQREAVGGEYYFVTLYQNVRCGLTRIYNIGDDGSFEVGSWLFDQDSPAGVSVLGAIVTKEIAYELLNLTRGFEDVSKENRMVFRYLKSYKPTVVRETDLNISFELDRANFEKYKQRYIELCSNILQYDERED